MRKAVYDIEGNGLLVPVYDSKTDILQPPVSKIWCMVIIDLDTEEVFKYRPDDMIDGYKKLQEYDLIIGHNTMGYDTPALIKVIGNPNDLGDLPPNGDTYIMSRLLWGPTDAPTPSGRHSIAAYGELFKQPKIDFNDWSKFTEEMLEYCVRDVELGVRVYNYLRSRMDASLRPAYEVEAKFAELMAEQEMAGATLDIDAHTALIQVLEIASAEARDRLANIKPPGNVKIMKTPQYYTYEGKKYSRKSDAPAKIRKLLVDGPLKQKIIPFNPNSTTQLADYFCNVKGFIPKELTDSGAPSFTEEVLDKLPYDEAEDILNYRVAEKRLSQCMSWLNYVHEGKVHGSINTLGATTFRCTHSNPNMSAVPASRKPFGKECRSVWIARPGWNLTGTDAKGLELRMLGNALYPFDNGAYTELVLSGEAHNRNQEILELPDRDTAKTAIYAFNYAAGMLKLGRICRESDGLREASKDYELHANYIQYLKDNGLYTEENVMYAKMGKEVRNRLYKNIHGLNDLIEFLNKQLDHYGWIIGIDGRRIPVESRHAILNRRLQSDGGIVMKYSLVQHNKMLTEQGFKLTEDYNYILNIHDEFQVEHDPQYNSIFQDIGNNCIRIAGEQLNIKCPLIGESASGKSWRETH